MNERESYAREGGGELRVEFRNLCNMIIIKKIDAV
jgi:hypothetical protein